MKCYRAISACLICSFVLMGCENIKKTTSELVDITKANEAKHEDELVSMSEEDIVEDSVDKQVVVYFPSWKLQEEGGKVEDIPWEHVTYVNHAFWAIAPADGTKETSFERRDSGKEARTEFTIVSTDPQYDVEHFKKYEEYSELYPDVNIMLSIGGWTRSGYFSEMAYTKEGRASFINSCIAVMEEYPWIDGIDIDWEYLGGSKDGERRPENSKEEGCPIFGTVSDDNKNFESLLAEMRMALDDTFVGHEKKLTAGASASTFWTLPQQKWDNFSPYLDYINIMTYDLAGLWEHRTGHASNFVGTKNALVYFKLLDVPVSKLCIGTPLYATAYKMKDMPQNDVVVGAEIEDEKPTEKEIDAKMIRVFEEEAVSGYTLEHENERWVMGKSFDYGGLGWHYKYDNAKGAAYMYNDDPDSPYYKWYLSYENHLALQEKIDFILEKNIGGIIVWECVQDTMERDYIKQIADNLVEK